MNIQAIKNVAQIPKVLDPKPVERTTTTKSPKNDTLFLSELSQEVDLVARSSQTQDAERERRIESLKRQIALDRYEMTQKMMDVIVENLMAMPIL